MEDYNSFWPVYKNFEEETIELTKFINFSDDQLKVYSMHIADLIMRIVVEIEALSKELYRTNNGPDVFDDNNNKRELFFDTDCIGYLNSNWGICNREIIVSCANFNFTNQEYKILKPLKNANKRGTSSAKWNKAYQAVKHDRRKNLFKGNIENLISGLGALYILNLYYRNDNLFFRNDNSIKSSFDNRFGSDIFAATFADASKASVNTDNSDNSINKEERAKLATTLCVIKYTDDSWEEMHKELFEYNHKIINELIQEPQFKQKLNERVGNLTNQTSKIIKSIIEEMQMEYVKKKPPIKLARLMSNGQKEIILNKGQAIYK